MNPEPDIYVVGLGLVGLRQLTLEAADVLRKVRAVYHLSGKHRELLTLNDVVHDLNPMYEEPWDDGGVYVRIAELLVESGRREGPIAVAFDGNPLLCGSVAWKLVELGVEAGLRVEALAGVSSLDILPMQLGFDPGDLGMQTLEATQMVQYGMSLNPYLPTLLLQAGYFGFSPVSAPPVRAEGGYALLVAHLLRYFPPDHPAVFIQSAVSAEEASVTLTTEVGRIDEVRNDILPGMTLYLPRIGVPEVVEAKVYGV